MMGGTLTPVLQELCQLVEFPKATDSDVADDDFDVPPPPPPPRPPAPTHAVPPPAPTDALLPQSVETETLLGDFDDIDGSLLSDGPADCASPKASPDRTVDDEVFAVDDASDDVEITEAVCNCATCIRSRQQAPEPVALRRSNAFVRDSSEEASRAPAASASKGGQKPVAKAKGKAKPEGKAKAKASTASSAAAPVRKRYSSKAPEAAEPDDKKQKAAPKTAGAPDGRYPSGDDENVMFSKLMPPFELTHRQPTTGRRGEAYVLQNKAAVVRYTGVTNQGKL